MPLDRGAVERQLHTLGEGPGWWEQRELRDLPGVLQNDELIRVISRGRIARLRWLRPTWLIVVTDRRLLCLRSARTAGWRQLEIDGGLITRVTLRVGPFRGRVVITAAGRKYRLLTPRSDAVRIINALSTLVPQSREHVSGFRPTVIARRVIDHMLALPAVVLNQEPATPIAPGAPAPDTSATDEHIRALEEQLQEMRQQVEFLEQLLHRQHALPRSS